MNKKSLRIIVAILIILSIQFTQTVFADTTEVAGNQTNNQEYLKQIMDMVKDKYNGDVNDKQLMEGALKGMFGTMDPYTVFFTPTEGKSFLNEVSGTVEGIGVSLGKVGNYVIVMKVFPASPAEQAGITIGSKIVTVDGKNTVGSSIEEVASLTKGEAGTKVTLGIIKNGETAVTILRATRAQISINPVTYEIRDNIAYINISIFNSNTQTNLMLALYELDKKKIKKIVLDLRNNPGGDVGQAVSVAERLVPKGLITTLDFKSKEIPDETFYAQQTFDSYKIVVLVNGMTASASEILAGAIQDRNAGTLVGTKTFGKGVVQDVTPILTPEAFKKYNTQLGTKISDANELRRHGISLKKDDIMGYAKITIGEYRTPNGRNIDKVGLTPEFTVDDYNLIQGIDVNAIEKLTKTLKFSLNDEGLDVFNAERILKICGYDIDSPDTKLDEKTVSAIKKLQTSAAVYASGNLDFTTQQILNSNLDYLRVSIDKQYAKAVELLK